MTDQEKAIQKLSKLKCGALFMEMGSGKTKTALDIISIKSAKVDCILWICPHSLINEIEKERTKWHPEISLIVVGCESIGSSDRIYARLLKELEGKSVFCVVDESLKIKNLGAKRTRRILHIGSLSCYRLILNGTPVTRDIIDLYTQMEFLSPLILSMTYRQFCFHFVEYSKRTPKYVTGYKNVDKLINIIEPYIFESNLSIESTKHYKEYFYSNDCQEEYDFIKDEILERVSYECSNIDFYELCSRLQRCYAKSKSRDSLISDVKDEIDGKVIIFVKYLSSIPEDEKMITGTQTNRQRLQTLKDFEHGVFNTLYLTYGVGAFGLNLQHCNNIIFLDHSFDYAQRVQAEYRIYRIGQKDDVYYHSLYCECKLEKMIQRCVEKKCSLLGDVKRRIEERGAIKWAESI